MTTGAPGLDVAARERLGDEVRLVARVELIAQVLDVTLDGARGDPELLGALLRGEPASDALEDFPFALGERDEIFLWPRDIHHQNPYAPKPLRRFPNNVSYHRLTAI